MKLLRRDWEILEQFKLPFAVLLSAVVYGTVGYIVLFGWGFFDALYMTAITLTTVGYREVEPIDSPGTQLFTISVLVVGISALFTAIGVFANMIATGELSSIAKRRTVRRQVAGLSNHYIVCAYGRVGRSVVEELRRQGASVMVVDVNPGLEPRLQAEGVPYLIADPSEEGVLHEVGLERASGLVCAVDSDEVNVYITLTARALNPNLTIVARAARPQSLRALEKAGANHIISPYTLSGNRMAALSLHPSLVDFIDMVTVGPNLRLDEILVQEGSPLIGMSVDAACASHHGVTILAHKRESEGRLSAPPDGDALLTTGDLVVAFGPREALEAMEA